MCPFSNDWEMTQSDMKKLQRKDNKINIFETENPKENIKIMCL